jgi:hypothetical protein
MSVIINLKELFPTDSQSEVASKFNFNFNQLLSLGVGQVGPIGPIGSTGSAGPIGPIGPIGPAGSYIYSQSTSGGSPTGIIPIGVEDGDVLISSDTIWQRNTSGTSGWTEVVNFNDLVQSALTSNSSPLIQIQPGSRIVKPRITNGIDLTNSATATDPNYSQPGLPTNYQTVLYNFNEANTYSIKNNAGIITVQSNGRIKLGFDASLVSLVTSTISYFSPHGLSTGDYVTYSNEGLTTIGGLTDYTGYFVYVVGPVDVKLSETYADAIAGNTITFTSVPGSSENHSLITALPDPEYVFPQTANLMLYSFFDASGTESREFATTLKGYRHQLELGSVDAIPSAYDGTSSYNYLISPSFENLRIKRYRLSGDPAWNPDNPGQYYLRAEYNLSSNGYDATNPEDFSPRRNSEHIWLINKGETDPDDARTFEMRFTNRNITQFSDATLGSDIDGLVFKRNVALNDLNTSMFGIGYKNGGNNIIGVNSSADIDTFDFYNLKINLSSATSEASLSINGSDDLVIEHSDNTKQIRLNNAVKVKGDRLNAGLPFASTSFASSDVNTLDHYAEGVLGSDSTHTGRLVIIRNGSPIEVTSAAPGLITYSRYTYTRIGRQVTIEFTASIDLNNWPADGGGMIYGAIGLKLPFSLGVDHSRIGINVYDASSTPYVIPPSPLPLSDETTYANYVGMAVPINGLGSTELYLYLYSPHTLPADTGTSPANQFNRYILFNRDARNPKDLGASSGAKWADSCVITASGTYFTTT